ncbi:peroxiredoxin [Novosphingobium aerophilum]|uniref:thioredoxin-dependent peroxiredoxin n=1 Tax=Novosphingobium aerophilum TaxID=2839843 RepID=A0A7X1F5N8_9SPHN|nr:peroxiredoxin [Novosphingobium aerophilum]MBC2650845.1 peroxiredoxin [Novosphingobium aerophilum]
MNRTLIAPVAALSALVATAPAMAALPVGAPAPQIVTQGAIAGKTFTFDLQKALKKGPVVLYFFPKAFTQGCTLETKAFADASDKFAAAKATIVGMSADDLPTLQKFSTEACRSKFGVATAGSAVVSAYKVSLLPAGIGGMTNRTSYVIARDGKIVMVHSEMDWREHVARTLAAVEALKGK